MFSMWFLLLVGVLQVYVSQLSTADENLIIAAEGLCQISPPREIATLLQYFSAGSLTDTKRALCAIQEQLLELKQQQEAGAAAQARPQGRDGKAAGAKGAKQKAGDSNVAGAQPDPLAEVIGCRGALDANSMRQ